MVRQHTAILMGTYNAAPYLSSQIESIVQQSMKDWSLWVSDDGSTDATHDLLKSFQSKIGLERLHILQGPKQGFVCNFLSLVCNPAIQADYFAYADQDDIWLPGKLQKALEWLQQHPSDRPALYCSRTIIANESGEDIGLSLLKSAKPSFANALVHNISSGNTMVFNASAREVLQSAGCRLKVFAHDWWTYLAVMAVGGVVLFDPVPLVRYRQHGSNLIGATRSLRALYRRSCLDLNGKLGETLRDNIAAMENIRDKITMENSLLLKQAATLWHWNPLVRSIAFFRLPFKRQRFLGNCSLALAVLLRRI